MPNGLLPLQEVRADVLQLLGTIIRNQRAKESPGAGLWQCSLCTFPAWRCQRHSLSAHHVLASHVLNPNPKPIMCWPASQPATCNSAAPHQIHCHAAPACCSSALH
jgi:hypothetical protein